MSGPYHSTDEKAGESDTPDSYGPSPSALSIRSRSTTVSRQDEPDGSGFKAWREPKPGKELNFH